MQTGSSSSSSGSKGSVRVLFEAYCESWIWRGVFTTGICFSFGYLGGRHWLQETLYRFALSQSVSLCAYVLCLAYLSAWIEVRISWCSFFFIIVPPKWPAVWVLFIYLFFFLAAQSFISARVFFWQSLKVLIWFTIIFFPHSWLFLGGVSAGRQ